MADVVCISMTQGSHGTPTQRRRSFGISHGATAFVRRLSRSMSQYGRRDTPARRDTTMTRRSSPSMTQESPSSRPARMHVRIVPSIENPNLCLIFDVIDRELEEGVRIKMGRFTERAATSDHLSFRSKVVSRTHCELWLGEDRKLYLQDTKSSSGTFVNRTRLSSPYQESRPVEIKDNDVVQLGVDYRGGQEEMYRSVKMRFEINRPQLTRPLSFHTSTFQALRSITSASQQPLYEPDTSGLLTSVVSDLGTAQPMSSDPELDECCICLYVMAHSQALFVAPCSHSFHYKCIRPLLQSHPGFQCPICRSYANLEASVADDAPTKKAGDKEASSLLPAAQPVPETIQGPSVTVPTESCTSSVGDVQGHSSASAEREPVTQPNTVPTSSISNAPYHDTPYTSSMHEDITPTPARQPELPSFSFLSQFAPLTATSSHHDVVEEVEEEQESEEMVGVVMEGEGEADNSGHPPAETSTRPDSTQRKGTTAWVEKLKSVLFEKRLTIDPKRYRERKRRLLARQASQSDRDLDGETEDEDGPSSLSSDVIRRTTFPHLYYASPLPH